jgi:hypothetical protein
VRVEVVLAERRRDVHDTGAGVERDEVRGDDAPVVGHGAATLQRGRALVRLAGEGVERRPVATADELGAAHSSHDRQLAAELLRHGFAQGLDQHQLLAAARIDHDVVDVGLHRRVAVRWQRPRGGGPDA